MTNDKANFKAEIESIEVEFWENNDGTFQHLAENGYNSIEFDNLGDAIASAKEEINQDIQNYGSLPAKTAEERGEDSSWQSFDEEF